MIIKSSWKNILREEFQKNYYTRLKKYLEVEYESETIFPPKEKVFAAFSEIEFEDVKIVILGQDPYHGRGQAEGLSFSVEKGIKKPPSLQNILKEWKADLEEFHEKEYTIPESGSLNQWARNGVLLLNTVLTVREGQPGSHRGKGWEQFTNKVIELLGEREEPIVFILWGKPAEEKAKLIKGNHHLIIKGPHPSPLSAYRGFFGGRYFSKAEKFLNEYGYRIDWSL